LRTAYVLARDTFQGFLDDDALTRAAAIAYFTLFSLGPLIFLASGIASIVFGEAEVRGALAAQLRDLLGRDAGTAVQEMAESALGQARGGWALAIGVTTLIITASGAFAALQGALNAIWKSEAPLPTSHGSVIAAFLRARALSVGLVGTTGFLLLASLVASAAISALGGWLTHGREGAAWMLSLANFMLSFVLISCLFAAVFKILPDRRLQWRDVVVGAIATAFLFTLGKTAIGFYIGRSGIAESFGAAGSLAVVLLWLYYSAVIFLLGAEFTRAWSGKEPATPEAAAESPALTPAGLVRLDGALGGGVRTPPATHQGWAIAVALLAAGLALRLARR
jgi:membrane protein